MSIVDCPVDVLRDIITKSFSLDADEENAMGTIFSVTYTCKIFHRLSFEILPMDGRRRLLQIIKELCRVADLTIARFGRILGLYALLPAFMPQISTHMSNQWASVVGRHPRRAQKILSATVDHTATNIAHAHRFVDVHAMTKLIQYIGEVVYTSIFNCLQNSTHDRGAQIELLRWSCSLGALDARHKSALLQLTLSHEALHNAVAAALGTPPRAHVRPQRRQLPLSFGATQRSMFPPIPHLSRFPIEYQRGRTLDALAASPLRRAQSPADQGGSAGW